MGWLAIFTGSVLVGLAVRQFLLNNQAKHPIAKGAPLAWCIGVIVIGAAVCFYGYITQEKPTSANPAPILSNSVSGTGNTAVQGNNNVTVQGNNNTVQSHDASQTPPSTNQPNEQGHNYDSPSVPNQSSTVTGNENISAQGNGNEIIRGNGNRSMQISGTNDVIMYAEKLEKSQQILMTGNYQVNIANYYGAVITNVLTKTIFITNTVGDDPGLREFTNSLQSLAMTETIGYNMKELYIVSAMSASNSLALLDAARGKQEWWALHVDPFAESIVAVVAAAGLDEMFVNPPIAFDFSKRAYDLVQNASLPAVHTDFVIGEYANASSNFGAWLIQHKRYQESIDHFAIATDIYEKQPRIVKRLYGPNDQYRIVVASWYAEQAFSYLQLGSNSQALHLAETAVRTFPSDDSVGKLAYILRQLKDDTSFSFLFHSWYDVKISNGTTNFLFRNDRAEAIKSKTNSIFLTVFANRTRVDLSDDRLTTSEMPNPPGSRITPKFSLLIPVDAKATNASFLFSVGVGGVSATKFVFRIDTVESLGMFPLDGGWFVTSDPQRTWQNEQTVAFLFGSPSLDPIIDYEPEPFGIPINPGKSQAFGPMIIRISSDNYPTKFIAMAIMIVRVPPGAISDPPSLVFPTEVNSAKGRRLEFKATGAYHWSHAPSANSNR